SARPRRTPPRRACASRGAGTRSWAPSATARSTRCTSSTSASSPPASTRATPLTISRPWPPASASPRSAMQAEAKLGALGLELADPTRDYRVNLSGAKWVSHLAVGQQLYLSGMCAARDGRPYMTGIVGETLTVEQGYEAARHALLTVLGVVKYALGDLDRVTQAVQMTGFVNSGPTFSDHPRVINGATALLGELYGDRGKPTRAAIGCRGLALGHSVEIVLSVLFAGADVRPPLHRDRAPGAA